MRADHDRGGVIALGQDVGLELAQERVVHPIGVGGVGMDLRDGLSISCKVCFEASGGRDKTHLPVLCARLEQRHRRQMRVWNLDHADDATAGRFAVRGARHGRHCRPDVGEKQDGDMAAGCEQGSERGVGPGEGRDRQRSPLQ